MTITKGNACRPTEIETLPRDSIINILSSRVICSDTDFLSNIQQCAGNIKIIFCNEPIPYVHLYKNEDEAFSIIPDNFIQSITKEEYDKLLTFNTDEKISVFMDSLQKYLIDKNYDETQEYVLFYCGTYIRHTTYDDKINVYSLINNLKLLQIL